MVCGHGGFIEYISNRGTESVYACSEQRYALMQAMASNPQIAQVDAYVRIFVAAYVKEGAFYVEKVAKVMAPIDISA